jgi:RimJ/RimL family protein N-acetyltransferase
MAEWLMKGEMSTEDRLYRDKEWIARTPGLANGGIALAVVEPETVGWQKLASLLDDYGFIAFASADKRTVFDQIREQLGNEGDLPYWDSFTAYASDVKTVSDSILEASGDAFSLASDQSPDFDTIREVVSLNREVGVSPLPAWYMQGGGPPSLTAWIRSPDGQMIACANGSMRYHPDSRMAGTYYVGSVSVSPSNRGKGLGTLVTASLIRDGVRAFKPTAVTGVAQPTNIPSRAMLTKCGLYHDQSRATVIYNRSRAFHTR